ncbi:hypothetical protein WI27_19765 [Burkholderia cepacia]|nr:hypothetical protein WI27_19765 [Burkholderia cepacia]
MANAKRSSQSSHGARVVKLSDYRTITREIQPPSVDHELVDNTLFAIDTLFKAGMSMIEKLRAEVRHG